MRGERFNPAFFLSMRKKAPLTVERKNGKGGVCVGTNFTSLAPPQAAGLVRFVVPPFPARIASLDSRGNPCPFAIPLKTTKKRADAPFLDFSRGLVCAKHISNQQKTRCRCGFGQTGEVVEILCVFFDFHTSNIQRALTERNAVPIVRLGNPILRSPEGRSLTAGVTITRTTERHVFLRVSAISFPSVLFFHIFSRKREKIWSPKAQLQRRCKKQNFR